MSYDAVEVLAAFAERYGITYPLLSDVGSRAIRDIGLLNQHLDGQHAHYGTKTRPEAVGVPYPGVFVLDPDGIVVEKKFEQSYRIRPTAVSLVETVLGGTTSIPGVKAQAATDELQTVAWFGTEIYRPYQRLWLNLAISIAPGLHVYAAPVPAGYTPLSVEVEPLDTLEVGPLELPAPHPFHLVGHLPSALAL